MSQFNRKSILLSAAVAAAITTTDYTMAQQATLEEVLVTARKREESLQQVPMAVSAFSTTQLRDAQVDNILDLERMTPNVTLTDTGGLIGGAISVFIRGIGQDPGFGQGVGIYMDDVYLNRTTGALLEVYDVERIEILKGPQGNLYGRNTIGGAIKYITRQPSDEFEADIEVKGGDYDLIKVKGNVSGPLIQDTLYGSFGAMYKEHEGIQENTFDGSEYWGADVQAYRGSLLWQATESLSFNLAADYMKDESDPRLPNRIYVGPLIDAASFVIGGANQFLGPGTGVISTPNDTSLPTDIDTVSTAFGDGFDQYEIETTTVALTAKWDISDSWSLKSVTALRSMDNVQPFDFDGSEQFFIETLRDVENDDFSQEFQFNYSSENINAVMGFYYLDADRDGTEISKQSARLRFITNQFKATSSDDRTEESTSVYANVDWSFTDSWQLSVGGRYTKDEKDETITAQETIGYYAFAGLRGFPPEAILSVAPGQEAAAMQSPLFAYWASSFAPPFNTEYVEITGPANTDQSDDWTEFTPSAKLTWFLSDDVMIYGGFSSGFKSGGFQRTGGVEATYDPETVDTWSLGLKSTLLDGTLRFNTELFFNDYTDKQLSTVVFRDGSLDETVDNVGELETSGIEAEVLWLPPLEGMTLGLNVGYLDTDVKEFENAAAGDLSDTTAIGFSPEWTVQGRVSYDFDIASAGFVTLAADFAYRDESFTNSPIDTTSEQALTQLQDEHVIWNAMAAFTTADGHWRFAVEGKNLDDERVITNSFNVGALTTAGYNMPRTWAVSVGYTF